MNLIDYQKLTECRKALKRVKTDDQEYLDKAIDILDDLLEFKIFPDLPGLSQE